MLWLGPWKVQSFRGLLGSRTGPSCQRVTCYRNLKTTTFEVAPNGMTLDVPWLGPCVEVQSSRRLLGSGAGRSHWVSCVATTLEVAPHVPESGPKGGRSNPPRDCLGPEPWLFPKRGRDKCHLMRRIPKTGALTVGLHMGLSCLLKVSRGDVWAQWLVQSNRGLLGSRWGFLQAWLREPSCHKVTVGPTGGPIHPGIAWISSRAPSSMVTETGEGAHTECNV